ncbi:MAG: hypothetical protein HUJ91_01040 [Bacteroidales bacterium]|nr:hypothetical protein [Bacteroidales bacterium]
MKKILRILSLLLLVVPTGCDWLGPKAEPEVNMVLVYLAGNNNLSSYISNNITEIVGGYIPPMSNKNQQLLVFISLVGDDAVLRRYCCNKKGEVLYEDLKNYGEDFDACTPDALAQILDDAELICHPTHRTMLFSSHGSAWLPSGYYSHSTDASGAAEERLAVPVTKADYPHAAVNSIGQDADTGNELDITDFARIAGRYHWDSILIDCCYGGSVELAYELRSICDYLIGSAPEILGYGFPYKILLNELFNNRGEVGLKFICQKYYEMYYNQIGMEQSGCIALVDCSQLEALADICRDIVADRRSEMSSVKRGDIQPYHYVARKDYFFDLGHYYESFATAEQYRDLTTRLDAAVICKYATPKFLGVSIDHFSGLSTYIPKSSYVNLNAAYRQTSWNRKVKVLE